MYKLTQEDILLEFDKFAKTCYACDYGSGIKNMLAYIREYIVTNVKKIGDLSEIQTALNSKKSKKDGYRRILKNFYRVLIAHYPDSPINNPFADFRYYNSPIERQLEIAKFLHESHTTEEIALKFKIDERTVRSDLDALARGVKLFDYSVQIDCKKNEKKKYYHTTAHPIFLTLNITEIYALTMYLRNLIKDDNPNKPLFDYLENAIYSQLSERGKSIINRDNRFSQQDLYYRHDDILARGREGNLMYLFKSGETAMVEYFDGNTTKSVRAKIRWEHDSEVSLIDEDGNYIAQHLDADEINIIPDSFQYV